jgi:hypothetical protein
MGVGYLATSIPAMHGSASCSIVRAVKRPIYCVFQFHEICVGLLLFTSLLGRRDVPLFFLCVCPSKCNLHAETLSMKPFALTLTAFEPPAGLKLPIACWRQASSKSSKHACRS